MTDHQPAAPGPTAAPPTEPAAPAAAEQPAPAAAEQPALGAREVAERLRPRRAPRFGRFILAGVLAGAVLASIFAIAGPDGAVLGRATIFLLLLIALGSAGAVLGAGAAVVADRRSTRRAPTPPAPVPPASAPSAPADR